MTTIAAYRAEILKLRKRPGVRLLVAIMVGVVLLLGYLLLYVLATQTAGLELQGLDPAVLTASLRPASLPLQVLGIVAGPGSALGLILGALVFGGEYNWRTVATIAIQCPPRLSLVTGRVLALLTTCLVLVGAAFVGGAAGATIVALAERGDTAGPAAADVAAAFAVGALTVGLWASIGAGLATVLRGTAWAIGIGLLYSLAVESVLGLLPLSGRLGEAVARALISNNVAALVADVAPDGAVGLGAPTIAIDPGQALGLLLVYLASAVAITVVVFIRRDIAT